jgi:hypothetical protein
MTAEKITVAAVDAVMESIIYRDHWGIFLDDTGGPQLPGRHKDRWAWAAVVVPPGRLDMFHDLYAMAEGARRDLGVERLHFTDFFGDRSLPLDVRLRVLRDFVNLFPKYNLSIIVVQSDPAILKKMDEMTEGRLSSISASGLNMLDPSTSAHLDVVRWAIRLIRERYSDARIAAFSDPWGKKVRRGAALRTRAGSIYEGLLDPPVVFYEQAKRYPALQLADFAAWGFTRLEQLTYRRETPLERGAFEALYALRYFIQWTSPYASDARRFPYYRLGSDQRAF